MRYFLDTEFIESPWLIKIEEGHQLRKPVWYDEDEEMEDCHEVKDDILSPNIWWFRD